MALPERGGPAFAGDGHGQAVVLGLIQGVVSGAIQCEAIRIAKEQNSVSLEKRAETTYTGYRRQKASGWRTWIPATSLVVSCSSLPSFWAKDKESSRSISPMLGKDNEGDVMGNQQSRHPKRGNPVSRSYKYRCSVNRRKSNGIE